MNTQEREHHIPEIEPPPGLARRTCAKIWATVDSEEQESAIHSGTFLNSAFYSPESILPPSFLLSNSDSDETTYEPAQSTRRKASRFAEIDAEDNVSPPRPSRVGLIASISVGIIIALLLFPMIRFAEKTARHRVAEGMSNEISRRIAQYEQIHGSLVSIAPSLAPTAQVIDEILPFNLASNGWQEVVLPSSQEGLRELFSATELDFLAVPAMPEQRIAGQTVLYNCFGFVPTDREGPSVLDWDALKYTLLAIPGESMVRSAFGQSVIFKDGRIFVRILPGAE